jgi:biopolymer transport protein ExbD
MFNNKRIEVPKAETLNLIPIMDAIFLFIFFLLTSSQVIKFFEINSDAPIVQEGSKNENNEKLMLRAVIKNDSISLYRGEPSKLISTIPLGDLESGLEKFKYQLIGVKKSNPLEKEITLAPTKDISFQTIVNVLDVIRSKYKTEVEGDAVPLFPNIILEPKNESF